MRIHITNKSVVAAILLLLNILPAYADLQINEMMQSNINCILDELNEYPDSWVEVYNNSDQDINLSDYSLSVKKNVSKAYRLPDKIVRHREFVIIYCDKTDHTEFPEAMLHTDFRIDSGKGSVYLRKGDDVIDEIDLSSMPAPNIAYGRLSEDSDTWGYQSQPTPGKANCNRIVSQILPDPVFCIKGGIFTSAVNIELRLPPEAPRQATIYYTIDGSTPTEKSTKYTKAITVRKNTVIRAVLIADDYMSPMPVTQSYIFHPDGQTLPIVSMTGDPECFFDDKTGILTEGTFSPGKPNYMYNWRRPVNIEYFETDGFCAINQIIETRIKGSSSREKPLRSMVIYANKRFGAKRLNHEFFPIRKPGLTDFKSLELRNAGQDFHELFMRDALCQRIIGVNTDIDWEDSLPVVFYVNGKYKGMFNLRERSNEDYIYTNYNGLEDVDVIEN